MNMEKAIKQRRVKVYQLSRESEWLDKGTGFCSCLCNEAKDDACIIVRSEEDSAVLLLNSRIVKDHEYQKQQETLVVWTEPNGMDLALSFQEPEGCTEIWNFITDVKKHMDGDDKSSPLLDSEMLNMVIKLPEPTLDNLPEIEAIVKSASRSIYEREKLAAFVTQGYIAKLLPLFSTCEDLDARKDLHRLCNIMKGINDPEFPNFKANHREYLADNSKFKEIVKIKDTSIEAKIHETFRLQYLKDVVFARVFDDPTSSIITSLIFFNHTDICQHISQDDEFLTELFNILNNESEDSINKQNVVMFVQQLCSIAKGIHYPHKRELYRHGLFQIFDHSLMDEDVSIRTAAGEILASILDTEASIIRSHIIKQSEENKKTLAETIIERFIQDEDTGVKVQYSEALRLLLDMNAGLSEMGLIVPPESLPLLPKQDDDIDNFLNLFYEKIINLMVAPIMDLQELENDDAALRCLRACIGMKEDFYNRHFVRNNLFDPIIRLLIETEGKNNLLNSSCLELFEFIRRENIKILINNIIEKSGEQLTQINYVETFHLLQRRYEQNKEILIGSDKSPGETNQSQSNSYPTGHEGWSSATVDEEEEVYFNTSDDEDNNNNNVITEENSSKSIGELKKLENDSIDEYRLENIKLNDKKVLGLVDYPDDDDNNENTSQNLTKDNNTSQSSNGTSSKKGGLKILRTSQTLKPKLKKTLEGKNGYT
ncbi:352_t:CDS:10 [Diversispora eburnea]|uniref:352_t:CDS:1 n=1 Tax=Diversispora eburnea TaxID=1213867 RepID=A0A9N9FSL9_9GLOM|nr:352_t:CDS:10 [Diversispora eburnea]